MKTVVKSNRNIVYHCHYHLVFCPKYRRKVLVDGVEMRLKQLLAEIIERCRQSKKRFRFTLGDISTGRAWGDLEEGHIGRSMGPVKIPLVIANRRSMGGPGLLDHCIIKIEFANRKDGGVIYQHPTYTDSEVDCK